VKIDNGTGGSRETSTGKPERVGERGREPINFFAELKRRNVYKVAVAYAVVGWLLVQITTQVFPIFEIPNWALRLIVLAIIIGFPISLVIAWAFELTPEGIKHTEDVDLSDKRVSKNRTWIYVTVLGAALSVALFFVGRLSAPSSGASPTGPSEKSIAVLPFVNMSADKENEFFADGLSEEILNSLARIDGMRVVGRTSSFQFKGKAEDLRAIGQKLGAANVLEGSVRREGQRARVTAQLVRTSDGIHLWSQTYDRTLTDTLAVQLNIAEQVAGVLDVVLDDKQREEMRAAGVKNVDAFIDYQKGLKLYADAHNPARSHSVIDGLRAANKEFDKAIALEPGFSQAYFAAADLYDHIILADNRPEAEHLDAQRQALHYLELSVANSHDEQQRLLTLADRQLVDDDWHGLVARIDAALRAPGCSAPDWLPVFASIFGYGDLIEDLGARVSVCDPLNAINFNSRVRAALASGKPERALAILTAAERAIGGAPTPNAYRVQALVILGHVPEAKVELSKLEPTGENYYRARLMFGLATGESAASIHAALQGVDRSKSLYKMWKMNDVVEAALMGDRPTANRLAAEIDTQPGSGLVLAVVAADSLLGAPFDLEATPRFKARLAESGLPWPPIQALKLPPHTAVSNP
jgi:TolB-like protein